MAKRKIKRKIIPKTTKKKILHSRTTKSRIISFFIGVVTVLTLAFLIFQYAKVNNYKEVLGEKMPYREQVK